MKILAVVLALLIPALAHSKCNSIYYTISGRLVAANGAAIDGAKVEAVVGSSPAGPTYIYGLS